MEQGRDSEYRGDFNLLLYFLVVVMSNSNAILLHVLAILAKHTWIPKLTFAQNRGKESERV